MRLSELIAAIPGARVQTFGDPEIRRVVHDSRIVEEGDLFVAVRGLSSDGHRFVGKALERGARAIVVEDASGIGEGTPLAIVPDSRSALARLAARFYGEPTRSLSLAGVTGTNGKTTTTFLVEAISETAGHKTGVIGTVGYRFAGHTRPAPHTTPDPVALQSLFADMRAEGVEVVAMEISSHAIEQRRVDGCDVRVAAFTNLTQDHLDYHGTMEAYFAAKKRLFAELLAASRSPSPTAVVNLDDPRGDELVHDCPARVLSYSTAREDADIVATDAFFSDEGVVARVRTPSGGFELRSPLVGGYNLQNLLCATGVAVALEVPIEKIALALARCRGAPGRLERIENHRGVHVFVDYAHTPDALERVLGAVRAQTRGRLIAVFGCGGDRDRSKRPLMGAVAARIADVVVVTSDNPRTEDPSSIIAMIEPGALAENAAKLSDSDLRAARARGYVIEPDRRAAITLAIGIARAGDSVIIAGKGHEDYQILGTTKIHFDDREVARAVLERA
jgi:UDP-N-acetylmuramoyl-L-alanyl-D-glutamate--2,6-diaminopimelate ligase